MAKKTPQKLSTALSKTPTTYPNLLTRVKQTLIDGQARIEQERVRTYWETGKLIHNYILKQAGRAEYGNEVMAKLAKDLNITRDTLHRCVKFVQQYPDLKKVDARPQFSWSHYRKLIAIEDDKKRLAYENTALRHGWSSRELIARIESDRPEVDTASSDKKPVVQKLLTPLRGQLYTYRLVERPILGAGEDSGLLIDLGFGVFRNVDSRQLSQFSKDDIVESKPVSEANAPKPRSGVGLPQYRFSKTDRTQKDLFTYNAYVERVIDGDTLKVRIDLGFDTWHRETLRLRDIDCPEMDTKEGQEAKAFAQSYIKDASLIIVRSSRSDKYDRYLADVYIPDVSLRPNGDDSSFLRNNNRKGKLDRATPQSGGAKQSQELYLNNFLLEKGYAKRWG